jgi:hypothetical protein
MSHVSVINWIKQADKNLKIYLNKEENLEILELDELCVNFKKIFGSGLR